MNFVSYIVIFVVLFWIVFLILLPIGNKVSKNLTLGQVASAPDNPRLGLKALFASLISILITIFINFLLNVFIIY